MEPNFTYCPICKHKMYPADLIRMLGMDAPSLYQCEYFTNHRFYWHPFKINQINQINLTNWEDVIKTFVWVNNEWNESK